MPSGSRATRPPPFLVGRHTVVTARAAVKSRVRIGIADGPRDLLALSSTDSVASRARTTTNRPPTAESVAPRSSDGLGGLEEFEDRNERDLTLVAQDRSATGERP